MWRWNVDNTVTCENFIERFNEAACVQSWALGIAADGTSKTAYDACEVGCPLSDTLSTRTCRSATCRLHWAPFPVGSDASCDTHEPVCTAINCEEELMLDPVTWAPVPANPCAAVLDEARTCRHIDFRHFNMTVGLEYSMVTARFQLWDVTNDTPVPDLPGCKFEVLAGDNYRPYAAPLGFATASIEPACLPFLLSFSRKQQQ